MNYASIAILTGSALLFMAVVAGFTYGFAHTNLIVAHDATATLLNLQANLALFRGEVFGWLVIFLLDLVVSIGICYFFRSDVLRWSTAASALRIMYTAILGAAIIPLVLAERTISSTGSTVDASTATSIMDSIMRFETIWSYGLILFGVHLMVLGWTNIKSSYGSRFWGIMLLIAGVGYSAVHTLHHITLGLQSASVDIIEDMLVLPMTLGELGFAGWLIWKGIRMRKSTPLKQRPA